MIRTSHCSIVAIAIPQPLGRALSCVKCAVTMPAGIRNGSGFDMSSAINVAELDQDKVLRIDLGSQETKARMLDYCAEWGQRAPFYVPRDGHVIVICGRHADALE